jgi:hypothetical protein
MSLEDLKVGIAIGKGELAAGSLANEAAHPCIEGSSQKSCLDEE